MSFYLAVDAILSSKLLDQEDWTGNPVRCPKCGTLLNTRSEMVHHIEIHVAEATVSIQTRHAFAPRMKWLF